MATDFFNWDMTKRLSERWAQFMDQFMASREPSGEGDAVAKTAIATAPTIWLLGKVQSGKTSIVQAMTGRSDAEVGSGFRACTKTAQVFDFPAEAPLIRFLDTRGLGEAHYDAEEDLAVARQRAQLIIVVMRALDPQQNDVLDVIRDVRKRHPEWSLIVAQTCLHEAYPHGAGHVLPYPFGAVDDAAPASAMSGLPEDLERSLASQRALFDTVPGNGPIRFVPIDFTQEGDGFEPQSYGLEALLDAIAEAAPEGLAATLIDLNRAGADTLAQRVRPTILGYAGAAAACDVMPVAGAIAVPGVQAKLLHSLANSYGVEWDRRMLAEFAGCLGASVVARLAAVFGIQQVAKLIPVYGQTAGAAAAAATSFATTYALGAAGCYFLAKRKLGESDPDGVAKAYREALEAAFKLARERGHKDGGAGDAEASASDDLNGSASGTGTSDAQ
ncbi:MAG: GTPase domain-containing protein [Filomicrobium sp.]